MSEKSREEKQLSGVRRMLGLEPSLPRRNERNPRKNTREAGKLHVLLEERKLNGERKKTRELVDKRAAEKKRAAERRAARRAKQKSKTSPR